MKSVAASAAITSSPSTLSFSPWSHRHNRRSLLPIASNKREDEANFHTNAETTNIVPFIKKGVPFAPLSKDVAMGLALSAATGRGWTTGSGMEGPPVPADSDSDANLPVATFPWSLYTKSPRRRMRVAFTCNVCGQRTTRTINPHAYTEGTVFVQCCGCNVFHKLVDNLNLFHEMKCYISPSFPYKGDVLFNYLDDDDDDEKSFPA